MQAFVTHNYSHVYIFFYLYNDLQLLHCRYNTPLISFGVCPGKHRHHRCSANDWRDRESSLLSPKIRKLPQQQVYVAGTVCTIEKSAVNKNLVFLIFA